MEIKIPDWQCCLYTIDANYLKNLEFQGQSKMKIMHNPFSHEKKNTHWLK